jgi:hypothetical protein
MGIKYIYSCDYCNRHYYVDLVAFEVSDPGENTPPGWFWQLNEETLKCEKCRGGVPG